MNKEVSLAEAKATLSECIREVEKGKMLVIKRHGKPVAWKAGSCTGSATRPGKYSKTQKSRTRRWIIKSFRWLGRF
jgi:antitoxin (DNA-binding transcriptional repressor) of toxin-antitoxin stability system